MKNRYDENGIKARFFLFSSCFILALLLSMARLQEEREMLAARISPNILRLHILADTNQPEDQAVKLEIRSFFLDFLKEHLPQAADKQETLSYLARHQPEIEEKANLLLKEKGFPYHAVLGFACAYFPTRVYKNLAFPCGYYDTVRIVLGHGRGHNWWCVLYPRFCFADAACSEIPSESMEILGKMLNQDDFHSLQKVHPDLKIRFRLTELLSELTAKDRGEKSGQGQFTGPATPDPPGP